MLAPQLRDRLQLSERYRLSMNATIAVQINGVWATSGTLGAFVHDAAEIRGVADAALTPVAATDLDGKYTGAHLFHMTIYADDDGEAVSLQYYDGDVTYEVAALLLPTFPFTAGVALGSPAGPFSVSNGDGAGGGGNCAEVSSLVCGTHQTSSPILHAPNTLHCTPYHHRHR